MRASHLILTSLPAPLAVLCLLLFSVAGGAQGATFEPTNFDRLTEEAEQIFIGTVTSAISGRTFQRQIVTDFTFSELEVVKGDLAGSDLKVRMLGGAVEDEGLYVPGAPTFRIGDRYLLFVRGNTKVMFPTLGGRQGIYQVKSHGAGGEMMVFDYQGLPLNISKQSFVRAIQQRLAHQQ